MVTRSTAPLGLIFISMLPLASCVGSPRAAAPPGDYFGQTPPGLRPALFAPGVVSTPDAVELNGVFSPDMTEFYFSRLLDGGIHTIHRSALENGRWSDPEPLYLFPGDEPGDADDMSISADGREMYFLGIQPLFADGEPRAPDIWMTTRREGAWSTAQLVPPPISTDASEIYPVVVADGSLYFVSDREGGIGRYSLWRAQRLDDGGFAEPVNIGPPINTEAGSGDTFVAPDESYMVQSSRHPGGFGSSDLWVSFRNAEGAWGEPKNLGERINTEGIEYCPMVTPDGKHLFYSTRRSEPEDSGWAGVVAGDVYWVSTEAIEALRP